MSEEDRLDLIKDIREQIKDEDEAVTKYRKMAYAADRLGLVSEGDILRGIFEQEAEHGGKLGAMLSRMQWPVKPSEGGLARPYPQTYEEWADLGADIKETDPNTSDEVNDALCEIANDSPNAEDAKVRLLTKAGELGIT